MNISMKIQCYEGESCLHHGELCASCRGNHAADNPNTDHHEKKTGPICPLCSKYLIAEVGKTEKTYCFSCDRTF